MRNTPGWPHDSSNRRHRRSAARCLPNRWQKIIVFRSAWHDPRALFVGFKAGRNDVNHAHLDLGSFVLESDGVRWAQDLGSDNYNLPAYFGAKRWTYYRLNNRSHNTLTLGNSLQNSDAIAPISKFVSTPERAHAVADLTDAYPGTAKKILRGIALLDRARVLVQDDVTGLKPGTSLEWRLLTSTKIVLSNDARVATIKQDGRTLRVDILSPPAAKFSVSPATPPTTAENQNEGVTALVTAFKPETTDARLGVLLTPVGDHWPSSLPPPALEPLAEWK
ncbi:MAG: heparinase II/III-family protein [Verrucomicrobia bacterium]|nr:heparinase II/III-family protein [Verrucomicrobiota bacterium]